MQGIGLHGVGIRRNLALLSRGLNFLLRSDFNTNIAAPIPSPYAATPGPGTLTLVQTDGEFSVSSNKLNFPAQATTAWGDQGFYGAAQSRVAGRALVAAFNFSSVGSNGVIIAWAASAGVSFSNVASLGINPNTVSSLRGVESSGSGSPVWGNAVATAVDYKTSVVLRSAGTFIFIKGGAFTNWTLLWVEPSGNGATVYPMVGNYDAVGTLDLFRVLDLPAPFDTDYGLATQRLAGARTAGDTFTHEANCVIEWTQTTVPSGSQTQILFRVQDANNFWYAVVTSTGALSLFEYVSGVPTSRGSAAAVVSSGHRCVVVANGTTIRGYSNNVLRWTYSSASNFATATGGEVDLLGTGGAVSDLISWPRTLTGATATLLDAAVV